MIRPKSTSAKQPKPLCFPLPQQLRGRALGCSAACSNSRVICSSDRQQTAEAGLQNQVRHWMGTSPPTITLLGQHSNKQAILMSSMGTIQALHLAHAIVLEKPERKHAQAAPKPLSASQSAQPLPSQQPRLPCSPHSTTQRAQPEGPLGVAAPIPTRATGPAPAASLFSAELSPARQKHPDPCIPPGRGTGR